MSDDKDRLNDDTRPNELGDDTVPSGTGDSTMESPPGGTDDDPDRFDSPTIAPSAPDSPPRKPDRSRLSIQEIGDYEILSELGRGGFGVVFLAEDPKLGREVAVKVLAPQLASEPGYVERFEREAKSAARLKHPNIVSVYSTGESRGMHYMVMEKIEGRTVQELSKAGPLEEKRCIEILIDVCKGLSYAHEHGTIHRDLKPANIMVEDESKRVVIMDFGLARPEQGGNTLTQSGVALGTPVYMSPEQAKMSLGNVDRRSDLYSLGIVLYEMLTGRVPFTGKTPIEVLRKVVDDDPVPPRKLAKRMSQDLEAVILKAVEKDRDRRYQTATEFQEDLERILKGESVKAKKRTVVGRSVKWVKRNRKILAIAAGASIVVALGVGLIAQMNIKKQQEVARQAQEQSERARKDAEAQAVALKSQQKAQWEANPFFEDEFEGNQISDQWELEGDTAGWEVSNGALEYFGQDGGVAWIKDPVAGDFRLEFEAELPEWTEEELESAVLMRLAEKGLPNPPSGIRLSPNKSEWEKSPTMKSASGEVDGVKVGDVFYVLATYLEIRIEDAGQDQAERDWWRICLGGTGVVESGRNTLPTRVQKGGTTLEMTEGNDGLTTVTSEYGQGTDFMCDLSKYSLAITREGDRFCVNVEGAGAVIEETIPAPKRLRIGIASCPTTEWTLFDVFTFHRYGTVRLFRKGRAKLESPIAMPERLLEEGDAAGAEREYRNVMKGLDRETLPLAHLGLAQALAEQGKSDEGVAELRVAADLGLDAQTLGRAYAGLVSEFAKNRKKDEALEAFQKATEYGLDVISKARVVVDLKRAGVEVDVGKCFEPDELARGWREFLAEGESGLALSLALGFSDQHSGEMASLAKEDPDPGVRKAAVMRLRDQSALALIAETDKDLNVRWQALQKLEDQIILAEVVKTAEDSDLRRQAVYRINDQTILTDIARTSQDPGIRTAAVWRIEDQGILEEIARKDVDANVRHGAVQRLTDRRTLAEIAEKNPDPEMRAMAKAMTTDDQTALAEIAGKDENVSARRIATSKIQDQQVLSGIARGDADSQVRSTAVSRLRDQAALAEVVRKDQDQSLREQAIAKLFDQAVLAEIARNDPNRNVRVQAVDRLFDQPLLVEIAMNDRDENVRSSAVLRIFDQKALSEIVKRDQDWRVRKYAIWGLQNEVVLDEVAKTDENVEVCAEATAKICDQAILAEIAISHRDAKVRMQAVERLLDRDVLKGIEEKDQDPAVRSMAKVMIAEDQSILAEIAKADSSPEVRRQALSMLQDQAILIEISRTDPDEVVRRNAVSRIQDQKILFEIIQKGDDSGQIGQAISRLQDQSLLAEIAKSSEDPFIRMEVTRKLKDEALLHEISDKDQVPMVRSMAKVMISDDQSFLRDKAFEGENQQIQKTAACNLQDQGILAEIVKTHPDQYVRLGAVSAIKDQTLLAEMARKEEDPNIRQTALKNLTDKSVLNEVAENDVHPWVRSWARVMATEDQSTLAEIARTETHWDVRKEAIWKLQDLAVLKDIAQKESIGFLREEAHKRISELQVSGTADRSGP